ncbi:MAG: DNA/RNA nuclease SfsA [Syntrophales bacterium]|nr:DNA/RNA nuclease SfsA [Syntrophales bacterium]
MQDATFFGHQAVALPQGRNRFVIECDLDGEVVIAHLPNPGRLWELLLPGRTVFLTGDGASATRTTTYTAVAVEREGAVVLLHTQKTNAVVEFLLRERRLSGLEDARIIRREAVFGQSRFDFLLEREKGLMLLEVKSCTLYGRELAMFPDAATVRGRKHLLELAELAHEGYSCGVVFVVSSPRARFFLPDYHTDFAFARTFQDTKDSLFIKAVGISWHEDLTLADEIRDISIPWRLLAREARDRGCYILILRLTEDRTLTIGGLGNLFFPRGYYCYVGSAKRNLTKRLERHLRKRKKFFWHIDYLRDAAATCTAIPIRTGDHLEHELAAAVGRIADHSIPSFGSSDCRCPSHLFGMEEDPLHTPAFIELLQYFRMDRLKMEDDH